MEKKIKITIDKQGKATVEAEGFVGESCTEKTREILSALGPKRDGEEFKSEFFVNEQNQENTN